MHVRLQRVIAITVRWLMANHLACLLRARFINALLVRLQTPSSAPLSDSILQLLQRALREGHTCLSLQELSARLPVENGQNKITDDEITAAIGNLQLHQQIKCTDEYVALMQCAEAEEIIVTALSHIGHRLRAIPPQRLNQWLRDSKTNLSEEQREAVKCLTDAPVSILTGAPGTGKTSTVKALIEVFQKAGYRVQLAAPTGRAAQRLREVTDCPAHTLHKLLRHEGLRSRSFWNFLFPIADVLIVDEASMLDLFLLARLVRVCSSSTRLILVGDVHQLPSIGPGQVLFDLIESAQIPVVRLQTNYRQNAGSQIITTAEAIKAGQFPALSAPGESKSDCYFIEAKTTAEMERLVINAATQSLPARCGANPYQDIQVLTPKHKGTLGTVNLNHQIQQALYRRRKSEAENTAITPASFVSGDRVLHTKNNYRLGIFNGQCGSVQTVTEGTVTVRYGEQEVLYTGTMLEQLTHGFAMSIHRSQGSEYPFVIIPIHESQYPMLNRELLYTALTRGQRMVVFIGSRRALAMAVKNSTTGMRQTRLKQLLIAKTSSPQRTFRFFRGLNLRNINISGW